MEILRFMPLGIGTGGVYALLAQGPVLVCRGSGLLNFSQGAIAMARAFVDAHLGTSSRDAGGVAREVVTDV
jgi:branched-subunit amino acid ABC-type transport system permease component